MGFGMFKTISSKQVLEICSPTDGKAINQLRVSMESVAKKKVNSSKLFSFTHNFVRHKMSAPVTLL